MICHSKVKTNIQYDISHSEAGLDWLKNKIKYVENLNQAYKYLRVNTKLGKYSFA